ncbi:GNS1/SUR4 family-domain-containing protein [Pseudomassariella vexata]|uniref:Elongation of fatty acids protein n=1 Tax=Pseudomassariella vexata TaxID=1141098 RepID=A0A1Y2EDR1_9PEZI|nr:GNS1/SUR4 family-domain-containing protein [Pseudomassariella vexata]ORY69711.1 GNS1/SUR4 family-domain-containing protein [Pseudomassariella vexata]
MASSPSVYLDKPAGSLFTFWPLPEEPQPIPPPHFAAPLGITIPDGLYQSALDAKVPITIAFLYAVSAKLLNSYNQSTGKKPWAISKTRAFRLFVVLHNVFLAVYSAWTFWGMFVALRSSIVSPSGPNGLAGTVDSFCKFHGTGGIGNAITYNQEQSKWETGSGNSYLTSEGAPSRVDVGRLWNDGLAFYGWIFYLSKFYEVLDTFIILAKGRLSSTLQTYHHAGAMMCMWAGMRFMSAPIWMFVFVNSGIHAMMYTYYTITAFNIRVPQLIKRTLTTLQITQFLIGASYAMVHSFVYYTVPVQVPIQSAAAAASSIVSVATTTPTAAAGLLDSLKKAVFGAAEAANGAAIVSTGDNETSAISSSAYEIQFQKTPCITTSGATFAIWLNVLYLAPLTYLFVSFFIASYVKRSNAEAARARAARKSGGSEDRRLSNAMLAAEKAGWDAARSIEKEVYGQSGESAVIDEEEDEQPIDASGSASRVLRNRTNLNVPRANGNGKKY